MPEAPPTFMRKWSITGSGAFNSLAGVAAAAGSLYAAEPDRHRIQKFTGEGVFLTEWGDFGNDPGQFSFPNSVAVGPGGNVYVADTLNHRIQKFTADGAFVTQWGDLGSRDGQFIKAQNVEIDSSGNVFVADFQTTGYRNSRPKGCF